jgi:CAAX protease family protein
VADPPPRTEPTPERQPPELVTSARLLGESLSGRTGLVAISGAILLLLVYYHRMIAVELRLVTPEWYLFGWAGVNVLCLLLVPVALVKLFTRDRLAEYGLTLGEWRIWIRHAAVYLAIVLPVIAIASRIPAFRQYYPMFDLARERRILLLPWELAYGVYFFAWEFFFRGYLLQGLRERFGAGAIIIQAIPFVMTHFGKVEAEAAASLVAGLALGVTAYRSRSMVGCWLVHWICAAAMDLLALC